MKVILLENLKKIGSIGEIIDVKRGYARNFLIANQKALYASKENVKQVEKIKTELSKKDLEKKKSAKLLMEKRIIGQIRRSETTTLAAKRTATVSNTLFGKGAMKNVEALRAT